MSAQPVTPGPRETRWVNPRDLVTRANVRAVAEPDPELVESVRIHGVLQPPLVYPDGDQLVLLAGHRRTAAAIAAGWDRIEVTVTPRMGEADRVAAQVSENTNRAGLHVAEVADAVAQLTLLGVPAGQIAKAAGLRAAQVQAARAVAEASTSVKQAIIEAPDLTLDQAAALTEWGQDPDAVADLLAAAEDGPVRFAHTQARLADQRETATELAAAQAAWIDRGYPVMNPDGGYEQLPAGAAYVRDLVDAQGVTLGVSGYYGVSDGHAGCADRAVLISGYRPDSVQEVCLSPKVNGHTKAPGPYGGGRTDPPAQDRAEVIAGNKAWKAATGVRHSHLGAVVRAGKFSAAMVNALHVHLLTHPRHLETPAGALFGTLTDFRASGATTTETRYGAIRRSVDPGAPGNRVTGLLLATLAESAEKSLRDSTWRHPNTGGTAWLGLLVAHTGYQLSDIEVTAMKATDPTWTPPQLATPPAGTTTAATATPARGRGRAATAR